MTLLDVLMLAVAGVLGGALNTAAAGGGVITFLACVLAGMPPQMAIATSHIATPVGFLSAVVPTWRQRHHYRPILPAVVAAAVGAALGVWLISHLHAHTFQLIVPALLVVAGILLGVQPLLPRLHKNRNRDLLASAPGSVETVRLPLPATSPPPVASGELERREPADLGSRRRRLALTTALFATALYAGGFGGGVGVAVLFVLATITGWAWHTTNTVKNGLCLIMSIIGCAAFLFTGMAHLPAVVVLVVGQIAGGVLGVWVFKHLSEDTLRRTVAVSTVFGALVMIGDV